MKNPLAQALGAVFQSIRDKMGATSSSDIAALLGLAASHYRMIEAGSAILQPARAIRVVQAFETIEFVPLCQVLVAIQILDSSKHSIEDMRTTADLLKEANPALSGVLNGLGELWPIMATGKSIDVARQIAAKGIANELETFLTTEPCSFSADQIDNFMTPTYQHPISGPLYHKIGNILQGVAPFYLDTILQLTDNLRGITPRVTSEELAKWEASHKNRISNIIGIIRKPEIVLNVSNFDYTFLWQENFQNMLIVYRDKPESDSRPIDRSIAGQLKERFASERIKYERQLQNFDEIVSDKLTVRSGRSNTHRIDDLLLYRGVQMNNLWIYIMVNGYVVPFIDNATVDSDETNLYGTSLAYDETCDKLIKVREICSEIGFEF